MRCWVVVLLLLKSTTHSWPAVARPKPKSNKLGLGFTELAQFTVVGNGASVGGNGGVVVQDANSEMAAILANEQSGVDDVIVSFEGEATLIGPLKVELTADKIEFVLADFTQFGDLVQSVQILEYTRQIILRIKSVGDDRKDEIAQLFQMLQDLKPIYVVEVDSQVDGILEGRGLKSLPFNDVLGHLLWHFNNNNYPPVHLNLKRGWQLLDELNLQTQDITIGMTSKAFDITHPDLAGNVWRNPNEVEDGIDNDGNGCIDDIDGCNFINQPPDGKISRLNSARGTIMAGAIGAITNNSFGIPGLSGRNNLKVMPIQISSIVQSVEALNHCYKMNVRISSHQIVGDVPFPSLVTALERGSEFNHLSFWPAGDFFGGNLSNECYVWPSAYDQLSMVVVAGIFTDGTIDKRSNFGNLNVHLAAPGGDIVALIPSSYILASGSWVATAIAAGIAGFILSAFPSFNSSQLKRVLLDSHRRLYGLEDKTIYPGIPDMGRALQYAVCEREFEEAVKDCNPQPTAEDIHFWRSAGSHAQELATKCQATCNHADCIESRMATMTPLCHDRHCDILDGVCADARNIAYFKVKKALPSVGCSSKCYYWRVRYSGFVEFRVTSSETDSHRIQEMAKLLREALLESLPLFEVLLDEWKDGTQLLDVEDYPMTGHVSLVYRLSSHTTPGIGRELRTQMSKERSRFMLSEFARKYCPNILSCQLHYSSEFDKVDKVFSENGGNAVNYGVVLFLLPVLSTMPFFGAFDGSV